jgi:transcriptional regulator GlxA family with amidase domain
MTTPRRVVIVAFEGVQNLDLVGPLEVFAGANVLLANEQRPPAYELRVLARSAQPLSSSSGLTLVPHGALGRAHGAVDTLIVPGGFGSRAAVRDRALLRGIARLAARARRVVSVCTGAFILAELGLLDGRRATTHWRQCARLSRSYPAVRVEDEPIFVRDGHVYTSAGVTAGIDLSLALIEEDLGQAAALTIARELVLFLRRPGNQAQFSAQLATQAADREPLREVQRFIAEHPGRDLSTDSLARRAHMSVRHFARCFAAEVGTTPARYVEQVRLEAARRRLTESNDGVDRVAALCGFGSAESLRRAFLRRLAVTPSDYRTRFRSAH